MGFLSDFVDGITGRGAAKASSRAARLQKEAADDALEFKREALAQQTELNQPYVDFGTDNMARFQGLLTGQNAYQTIRDDPYGADYLANNPLFDAAIQDTSDRLKFSAAAGGKANSGGLVNELFQNYLAVGDQFYGNYLNRLDASRSNRLNQQLMPISLGQAAAAGQAANVGNFGNSAASLATQGGNALAAGQMGAANAQAAGANNLLGLAGSVIGFGMGGGFGSFGGSPVLSTPGFNPAYGNLSGIGL